MLPAVRRICAKMTFDAIINNSKNKTLSTLRIYPYFLRPSINIYDHNIQQVRLKSKGDKSKIKKLSETETEEEENDQDFLDDITDKHTKTLKVNVTSMRLDAILKAGLGLSRNKIEVMFYESKIRLNGEKVLKKSTHVQEGDEIDIIKGVNLSNPNFITVARVELLSAVGKEESIAVKIRRYKSLTIENYTGRNQWEP